MAAVIRVHQTALFRRIIPLVSRIQSISTTQNKKENVATPVKSDDNKFKAPTKSGNWVSYGFDKKDETNDRNAAHNTFFISVTMCLVLGGYFLAYRPDLNLRDWAQREAFIQIRYREANNLPLIDPNLVDPKKVNLPSDEELGDTEIII